MTTQVKDYDEISEKLAKLKRNQKTQIQIALIDAFNDGIQYCMDIYHEDEEDK